VQYAGEREQRIQIEQEAAGLLEKICEVMQNGQRDTFNLKRSHQEMVRKN